MTRTGASNRSLPTPGLVLVAAILAIGVSREVFAPGAGSHRFILAAIRAAEVMLDVAFLVWLGRRLNWLTPVRFVASLLAINALACIGFALAMRASLMAYAVEGGGRFSLGAAIVDAAITSFYLAALYALGFRYPDLERAAHLRALEAHRLREQAELVQLRAHLQPHFLRNTLNAIAALVAEDPREARRMLATLGDLLSDSLQIGPSHSLEQEVAWLRRYAALLEARYHGALVFTWDVDSQALNAKVPTLLLQPLVENAALHGALGRDGDGRVAVRAEVREGGLVEIVVEDNGPGFDPQAVRAGALGLRLVERRLAIECPGASFRIDSSPAGTRAVVGLL